MREPDTRHVAATAWGLLIAVVLLVSLFTAVLTTAFGPGPAPGHAEVSHPKAAHTETAVQPRAEIPLSMQPAP